MKISPSNRSMRRLAEEYFVNTFSGVSSSSNDIHDFIEFYSELSHLSRILVENKHEATEIYSKNKNLIPLIRRNPSLNQTAFKNPSKNNFSVKINNHGVKKSLFSYATTSTEILQIIKRYVKPGDKIRLLSGTRLYNFKVLSNGAFKKV